MGDTGPLSSLLAMYAGYGPQPAIPPGHMEPVPDDSSPNSGGPDADWNGAEVPWPSPNDGLPEMPPYRPGGLGPRTDDGSGWDGYTPSPYQPGGTPEPPGGYLPGAGDPFAPAPGSGGGPQLPPPGWLDPNNPYPWMPPAQPSPSPGTPGVIG